MLAGLSPSSLAIAPAASPWAGPLTNNRAPVRGLAPGDWERARGLEASRVPEYGSEHSWLKAACARACAPRAVAPLSRMVAPATSTPISEARRLRLVMAGHDGRLGGGVPPSPHGRV